MLVKRSWLGSDGIHSLAGGEPKKIAFVLGTRPEAIKLAPLIKEFRRHARDFSTLVVVTGQHREMLDQALDLFSLKPDFDLHIMEPDQSLSSITVRALAGLEQIIKQELPDLVVVQGDTTTTFVGALAAFYQRIPVAHVEAGLRTGNRFRPFPEEVHRRLISVMADLHFVATTQASQNLLREGVSKDVIWMTGNTIVDALFWVLKQPYSPKPKLAGLLNRDAVKKILVTVHRRENYGKPLKDICSALLEVLRVMPNVEIIFPMHLSPTLRRDIWPMLHGNNRVHIISPLDYQAFVHTMKSVDLILTDSGGIQEEAPYLNTPVLVLRTETERPEGVLAGVVRMVGTDPLVVTNEVQRLLSSDLKHDAMVRQANIFGDGHACPRIVQQIANYFYIPSLTKVGLTKSHSNKIS
jgi:UDP-N-acetylglucosamine 2-epimerase (non-hydrolysing)